VHPINEELAKAGQEIFTTGALKSGSLSSACTDCHTMHAGGIELSTNVGAGVPTLTGYAGKDWLKRFIQNPAHEDFYGENNAMPAFGASMTERELQLLVDWMSHDYLEPPKSH
jgi:ubiquinol-cytochrome c reductase cytochrome b subunit